MKRLSLFITILCMMTISASAALEPVSFSPEKEKQIKELALKVAKQLAPDFDYKNLTPEIFKQTYSEKTTELYQKYSPELLSNDLVRVCFMDQNSKLNVYIFTDSMNPYSIGVEEFIVFKTKSFDDLVKEHPDFKIRKDGSFTHNIYTWEPIAEEEYNPNVLR